MFQGAGIRVVRTPIRAPQSEAVALMCSNCALRSGCASLPASCAAPAGDSRACGARAPRRRTHAPALRVTATASFALLVQVQRSGDVGSPRVSGSTNRSTAAVRLRGFDSRPPAACAADRAGDRAIGRFGEVSWLGRRPRYRTRRRPQTLGHTNDEALRLGNALPQVQVPAALEDHDDPRLFERAGAQLEQQFGCLLPVSARDLKAAGPDVLGEDG